MLCMGPMKDFDIIMRDRNAKIKFQPAELTMLYRLGVLSLSVALICISIAGAQIMHIHTGDQENVFDLSEVDSITYNSSQLSVEPGQIDFGQTRPETITSRNVNLTNTHEELLIIDRITFSNEEFYIEAQLPIEIFSGNPEVLEVFFSPPRLGDFAGNMVIHSSASGNEVRIVPLSGVGFIPFLFEETGVNLSVIVMEASINGRSLQPGDYIGVFNGEGICAGSEIVPPGFPDEAMNLAAWGAEQGMNNGLRANEELHFRFWIDHLDREVNAEVIEVLNGVEPVFVGNGFIVVRLRAVLD